MENITCREDKIRINTLRALLSNRDMKKRVEKWIGNFKCGRLPSLEKYVKEDGISDTARWLTTIYFVYDNEVDILIGYFSLKANAVIHKIDEETQRDMFRMHPGTKEFFDKSSIEERKLNVHSATPSVEISQFALNDQYLEWMSNHNILNKGVGNYIFSNYIKDVLFMLSDRIGAALIILFAYQDEKRKVIEAYQRMGFMTIEDDEANLFPVTENLQPLRELYDKDCCFMFLKMEDIVTQI